MKNFVKDGLVNFALIVLGAYIIPSIMGYGWEHSINILQLLMVTFLIRLLQLLTSKFVSRYPILEYLLELGMILAVVLGFGWLFKWYDIDRLAAIVLTVIVIYAAAFALDLTKTRRDVGFINDQIKLRREKISKQEKGE